MLHTWKILNLSSDQLVPPPLVDHTLNVACCVTGALVVPLMRKSTAAGLIALPLAVSAFALKAMWTWKKWVRVEDLAAEVAGVEVESSPLGDNVGGTAVELGRRQKVIIQELVAEVKLEAPLLSDTPANRAAVIRTMHRLLKDRHPDMRIVDCRAIVTLALEFVFIPDEADVLAGHIRRSTFAATMRRMAPTPCIK